MRIGFIRAVACAATVGAVAMAAPVQAQINVNIFSTFSRGPTFPGDGSTFSGLICTFSVSSINYSTFHPNAISPSCPAGPGTAHTQWATQFTGFFSTGAGSQAFSLNSDDGSALYIDGASVIQNDGDHVAMAQTATTNLTAGTHAFTLNYYEVNGDPAVVRIVNTVTNATEREIQLHYKHPASTHGQFRHARLTDSGTLMVAHMDLNKVVEYDYDGNELWSFPSDAPGA